MRYQAELTAALDAARLAATRILELYASFTAIPDAASDITTQADHDAQEIILQSLRQSYPGDAVQAEEATPTLAACLRAGPRVWVIDPIDGTRGFAQKNGEYSIMIALVEGGVPVVGVVWVLPSGVAVILSASGAIQALMQGFAAVSGRGSVQMKLS